jgi:hypothetical protein
MVEETGEARVGAGGRVYKNFIKNMRGPGKLREKLLIIAKG